MISCLEYPKKQIIIGGLCTIIVTLIATIAYEPTLDSYFSVSYSNIPFLTGRDVPVSISDFRYHHLNLSLKRELESLDLSGDISASLMAVIKKIRSLWLHGRTTSRKEYFDDEYVDASNRVRTMLRMSESLRWARLNELSNAIHKKIVGIQNPPDCHTAKLLVFDVSGEPSGFGSKLHIMTRQFIRSIYANRTFVLKTEGWGYVEKNWEYYLQPLGKCRYENKGNTLPLLSDKTQNERIVRSSRAIADIDWSVPENILTTLEKIHDDPYAWWVSQFVSYAFRFQPWFETHVQSICNRIGFTGRVAGIQIRWGDKVGREAAKHGVSEYMDLVDTFFRREGIVGNETRRVVYVATESSQAWRDLKSRYPYYHFIGSGFVNESENMASSHFVPYQKIKSALPSILADMYFLSKSDYVVCTLSSNICRTVYELMMPDKVMPSDRLQSLDQFYHLSGGPRYRVIHDHEKRNNIELDMVAGDELTAVSDVTHRLIDGYLRAINLRTRQKGTFPSYKADIIVKSLNSAVFEDL